MSKETNNNEIDLLLRRLGRREDGGASEALIDGEHLDADELSSYAQNALPAAARARYSAHLAECSGCRKLVTELSLSLGAATATEPAKTVPVPGGLKKFLASLFSPMVLRYAAPVLGVVLVMVVGFIVLRQRSAEKSSVMAQLDEKRVNEPVAMSDSGPKADAAGAAVKPDQAHNNTPGKPAEPKPAGTPGAEAAGAGVGAAPPAPKETSEEAPVVSQRQVQDLPASQSTPTTKLMSAEDKQKKAEDTAGRKQPETVTVAAGNSDVKASETVKTAGRTEKFGNADTITIDGAATAKKEDAGKDKPAAPSPAAGVATAGSRANLARRRAESERAADREKRAADEEKDKSEETKRVEKDDNAETETRSVAGRRFRKQRGVWVDTAYNSGKDATTVHRNSEQFRALVADEPAIRTIAEQLDGEILVVWKGRTYRIR
jgi:hypothetical protein